MRPCSWFAIKRFFLNFSFGLLITIFFLSGPTLYAVELAPYKDRLFNYRKIIESRDNGDFLLINYDKQVDLYQRDEIPVRKVQSKYVRMGLRRHQTFEDFTYSGQNLPVGTISRGDNPEFAVIFIHGRNGDRTLGMKDYAFGGNFNRLKNLAVRNNGIYITPTMPNFQSSGVAAISALITHLKDDKRVSQIILTCASMGSQICSQIAKRQADVARLSGLVILGGAPDSSLARSHATAMGLPIVLSHGTDDNVYSWRAQLKAYQQLKVRTPRYPVKLILFQTGVHGTPIRMIDWRQTLNWIFERS